jgi:hypothetical protein
MSMVNKKSFLFYLLFSGIVFFFNACPGTVDPDFDPPGPVRIIPYGGESIPVEKGLRSSVGNDGVIIEWEKPVNPETPIREYRIFRSLGLDSPFTQIETVFDNENAAYQDNSIVLDTMYFYYIQAVDSRGKSGSFQADSIQKYAASIMVKRAANTQRPFSTDTVTTKPYLSWCYPITDIPAQYIIKIAKSIQPEQIIWIAKVSARIFTASCDESSEKETITFNPSSYTVPNDSLTASSSVTVTYADPVWIQGSRLPKGNYFWRIESRWGNSAYHSRSNWGSFSITKDFIYP